MYQEGNNAYLVVSRFDSKRLPETRAIFIYSLTNDYLDLQEEMYWSPGCQGNNREAPWIFQRGGLYYMTMSHTRGWKPSETYYWTSNSLSGPWTNHGVVNMLGSFYSCPFNENAHYCSHNSQHRYVMKVGDSNQWIFGGDRYPLYEPDFYPELEGEHIMCQVVWDDTYSPPRPTVVFELEWSINA